MNSDLSQTLDPLEIAHEKAHPPTCSQNRLCTGGTFFGSSGIIVGKT